MIVIEKTLHCTVHKSGVVTVNVRLPHIFENIRQVRAIWTIHELGKSGIATRQVMKRTETKTVKDRTYTTQSCYITLSMKAPKQYINKKLTITVKIIPIV